MAYALMTAALWLVLRRPIKIGVHGGANILGLDIRLTITVFGCRVFVTVQRESGRVTVRFAINLFRLYTWKKQLAEGAGGADADGESEGEPPIDERERGGIGALFAEFSLLKYVWRRWRALFVALRQGLGYVWKRVVLERLHVDAMIGCGDASRTARAYGTFWALFGLSAVVLRKIVVVRPPRFRVVPAYNEWSLRARLDARLMIPWGALLSCGMIILWTFVRLHYLQPMWRAIVKKAVKREPDVGEVASG